MRPSANGPLPRSSAGRFQELVEELRRLDPQRIRTYVHATLTTLAEREGFEAATRDVMHAELVQTAARCVVKSEILASYRERVSAPVPVARLQLVKRAVGD